MTAEQDWFEDEAFWRTFAPYLFSEARYAAAPVQVDFILQKVPQAEGAAVLDLCCGPGRHAHELARRGFAVTGVDRTQSYLDTARRRAADEELDIEWIKEDMRRFVRPGAFDLVLNLFTSFGYFADPADDRRVAANAYASLKPGGTLVMELMGKEVLARMFRPRDWSRDDDGTLFLEERELEADWGMITNHWILIRDGKQQVFTFRHRLYAGTELAALLRTCGFEDVTLFGGIDGAPYNHTATRLIVLARRP